MERMLAASPTLLRAGFGAAATLGLALLVVAGAGSPLLLASLGGSCVILFGMPDTAMAQPRTSTARRAARSRRPSAWATSHGTMATTPRSRSAPYPSSSTVASHTP